MSADKMLTRRSCKRFLIAGATVALIAAFVLIGCSKVNSGRTANDSGDAAVMAIPATAGMHGDRGLECSSCHEGNDQTSYTHAKMNTCLSTACHGSYAELARATPDEVGGRGYNPHDSHYGELECASCHKEHGQSKLWCSNCHEGMALPEGWQAAPFGEFVPETMQ